MQATTQTLPKETLDRMSVIFGNAEKKFYNMEIQRAEIILGIAKELEKLQGIIKDRIASTISRRFKRLGIPVTSSFIYRSLGPEYKSLIKREKAIEEQRERKSEGWDPAVKDFVTIETFLHNIDEDIISAYGRRTQERLLYDLGLELRELRARYEELKGEAEKLRTENAELKRRIK